MRQLPKLFLEFGEKYPELAKAYEKLGEQCRRAGPLDPKQRALVKLGISIGARLEGAVHSHVRKALDAGVQPDRIRHAVLLALPTIGLPSMMAALSWVEDILLPGTTRKRR